MLVGESDGSNTIEMTPVITPPQIYPLMGEAMRRISAIGKDSVNQTQGFKYRGIDAVMNMLYPVMAQLGLFIVPEVLEQTREERTSTKKVWDNNKREYFDRVSTLLYSILKVKYTMYAPDGSNVSAVVVGEGMDSGDKASNKALAVGLKYACFQMFMIPTEEMANDDPDRESPEVDPGARTPKAPQKPGKQLEDLAKEQAKQLEDLAKERAALENAAKPDPKKVEKTDKMPTSPVLEYLAKERESLRVVREVTAAENNVIWKKQVVALIAAKLAPDKKLSDYTQDEAENLIAAMYKNFDPCGTELKADAKPGARLEY